MDDDDDDNDGVYLTTLCYTMDNEWKGYEDVSCIIPAHNMAQWWAFVISDELAIRISYT